MRHLVCQRHYWQSTDTPTLGFVNSEEEAHNLSARMLPPRLRMRHDPIRRAEHQVSELAGRQNVTGALNNVVETDVEARRNDTAFVDSANEFHNDFARSVVVDNLQI